jgi:EmrB/QacA subfamily drug resistance transporter
VGSQQDEDAGPVEVDRFHRRRWVGLVAIAVAVGLVIVDITIVNVALPVIVVDLDVDATTAQWIQEAYTLTLAGLLLPAGRIADLVGRRKLLVVGLLVFIVGSVLAALADSGTALIVARVVQGAGGATILPTTLSLINATFAGSQRALAFAVWGSTIGAVSAVGPLAGGWITKVLSWPWVFWVNLLVGAVVAVVIVACVRESRDENATRGLDPVGLALSAASFVGIVFALVEGRDQGWWAARDPADALVAGLSPIPVVLAGSALTLAAFVGWQVRRRRRGRPVVLDVSLFAIPTFAQGNFVVFVVALGQLGLLFVLPLWLQNVLGYSPLGSGGMIAAIAVGAFAAAGATPPLAQRWGAVGVVRLGLVAEIVALATLAFTAGQDTSGWVIAPLLVVYGFGVGTVDAQLPNFLLSSVPVSQSGQAAGTQSTAQEVGSAVGVAVLGTVLFSNLASHATEQLAAAGTSGAELASLTGRVVSSAGTVIPGIEDPDLRAAGEIAFSAATRDSVLWGTAFLVVGLATTVVFRSTSKTMETRHDSLRSSRALGAADPLRRDRRTERRPPPRAGRDGTGGRGRGAAR